MSITLSKEFKVRVVSNPTRMSLCRTPVANKWRSSSITRHNEHKRAWVIRMSRIDHEIGSNTIAIGLRCQIHPLCISRCQWHWVFREKRRGSGKKRADGDRKKQTGGRHGLDWRLFQQPQPDCIHFPIRNIFQS